ncbi:hypothetical protein LTR41_011553 [Exophiala xenobiotica]|nr:hypothetical protein LTR41_011553 [Exophiala xenobiotica]
MAQDTIDSTRSRTAARAEIEIPTPRRGVKRSQESEEDIDNSPTPRASKRHLGTVGLAIGTNTHPYQTPQARNRKNSSDDNGDQKQANIRRSKLIDATQRHLPRRDLYELPSPSESSGRSADMNFDDLLQDEDNIQGQEETEEAAYKRGRTELEMEAMIKFGGVIKAYGMDMDVLDKCQYPVAKASDVTEEMEAQRNSAILKQALAVSRGDRKEYSRLLEIHKTHKATWDILSDEQKMRMSYVEEHMDGIAEEEGTLFMHQ